MKPHLIALLLPLGIASAGGAAASDPPRDPVEYEVAANRAIVRCGPGDQYYQTSTLPLGARVQVYRRDEGGWLGIRPPAEDNCWVRAADLEVTSNPQVARVLGSEVVAWIGSGETSPAEFRWQVRLQPGELVAVRSREPFRVLATELAEEYFRIAPPAGEYRWIHEQHVEPLTPDRGRVALADFQASASRVAKTINEQTKSETEFRDRSTERLASRADFSRQQPERLSPANKVRDFAAEVRDLDLRLALVVSQSPGSWDFNALRSEAERLTAAAETTLERGRARILLDRIRRYESLQRRYAGLGDRFPASRDPDSGASFGDTPSLLEEPTENRRDRQTVASAVRFDGRGWLLPVHSSRQESPPYALLDSDGQILQFVSPAPGTNLHRYLRKEVGVFGQRNPSGRLKHPHLTAHRVVDLQRHRR